jgi:tRNA pseudouridine55 synthase
MRSSHSHTLTMDGIFNINKATGMTSHDVVVNIRKLIKQKRVGHAGTLDPAASGVLPICVGQATRVAQYLSESGKAYSAEIVFGIVTDTYDVEGNVVRTASVENLSLAQIEQALQHFIGPQMQLPPRYSAIKLQGQPAYKRVRAGEEVILQPRSIVISQLNIINWIPPRLILAIECSKGTYIRSLAYDLGEQMQCGAYLDKLVRTRSGPFMLSDSVTLEELADANTSGNVAEHLYPPDTVLQAFPALRIDATTAEHVRHGNAFKHDEHHTYAHAQLARLYDEAGHFLAIAEWDAEHQLWRPHKVFC